MATIGFIGLGNMGLPMAQNLLKAGHKVQGYDVSKAQVDALAAAGGVAAPGVKAAATGVEVVITMLPAGQHVRDFPHFDRIGLCLCRLRGFINRALDRRAVRNFVAQHFAGRQLVLQIILLVVARGGGWRRRRFRQRCPDSACGGINDYGAQQTRTANSRESIGHDTCFLALVAGTLRVRLPYLSNGI